MDLARTIIIYDSVQYFVPKMKEKGIRCFSSFRRVTKVEKILRKLSLKMNLKKMWYGDWKKYIKEIDTVIIFATNRYDYIEYLADCNPEARIIVWYWNPVFRCFDPRNLLRKNIEYWSFDKNDCIKYNLQYNSTFYFDNIKLEKKNKVKNDVVFIGADKGRKSALDVISEDLAKRGLKSLFHIVPDKNSPNQQNIKPLAYIDYLKLISESSVILDYLQAGQAGATLRPMESIFFQKKLITNDPNIKQESFYRPANVFILGEDNFENIKDFVDGSYQELTSESIAYFDFSNWLNRFKINE